MASDESSLLFTVLLLVSAVQAADRTLNVSINPHCPWSNCARMGHDEPYRNNLVYIRSENLKNNSDPQYRIFWSTIGAPTVIITEVAPTADKDIQLDWTPFLEDPRQEPPFFRLYGSRYAGLGFSSLIEYDDVNNTGQVKDGESYQVYALKDAKWLNVSLESESDGSLIGKFIADLVALDGINFNVTIELRANTDEGRAAQYPRMLFTPGSVSVRVVLDHVPIHFNHSRFALEVMFASNDSSGSPAAHTQDKSISDEYSPGIFTVERVGGHDTWVQYRPVVYTKTSPGVSDSTRSTTGGLVPIVNIIDRNVTGWGMPYSLLQGISGIQANGTTLVRFNVSFGITDDDFYNATSYQEWTCEIGVGKPPIDVVSKNVRMLIAVGFGVPATLTVLGGAYVAYLKWKKRRNEQTRLALPTTTNYQSLTTD